MSGLINTEELAKIRSAADQTKIKEEREAKAKDAERQKALKDAFMAQELHPQIVDRLNRAVRIAAEQGRKEVEVVTFPAEYCTDGGRRINVGDPDWPGSLQGFAKRGYDYLVQEMRPRGFRIAAQITSYPDGFPGEVGIFLKW